MANLVLTYRCNLCCSYCFANEYVNHTSTDMSLETVEHILDFLRRSGETRVGLIGGEPTIHPDFQSIVKMIKEKGFTSYTVFTNGIILSDYLEQIQSDNASALININEPSVIGEDSTRKLMGTIYRIKALNMENSITLGINLYHTDYDFSFIKSLLELLSQHTLRVSVCVPNETEKRNSQINYLASYKNTIYRMFDELHKIDVIPRFDCNRLPFCLFKDDLEEKIPFFRSIANDCNFFSGAYPCAPAIDILPDKTVIRCFGLSDCSKVCLQDFQTLSDIREHYRVEFDTLSYHIPILPDCISCYEHNAGRCAGGCLSYRYKEIAELRQNLSSILFSSKS